MYSKPVYADPHWDQTNEATLDRCFFYKPFSKLL